MPFMLPVLTGGSEEDPAGRHGRAVMWFILATGCHLADASPTRTLADMPCPFERDSKVGYVDSRGIEVIAPSVEWAGWFDPITGLAPFITGGKVGFLNLAGRVEIEASFDRVTVNGDNGRAFNEALSSVSRDGKEGYVDASGKEVLFPGLMSLSPPSRGLGLAATALTTLLVDTNGHVVRDLGVGPTTGARLRLAHGLIEVHLPYDQGGRIEDKDGVVATFERGTNFSVIDSGLIWANSGGASRLLSASPTWRGHGLRSTLIHQAWVGQVSEWGLAAAGDVSFPQHVGYVDRTAKWIIPPTFVGYSDFIGDRAVVKVGDGVGIIDSTGAFVVEPRYGAIRPSGCSCFLATPFGPSPRIEYLNHAGKVVLTMESRVWPTHAPEVVPWPPVVGS